MKFIAAYAYSTGASALKRLQTWALCGAVALAGLLGAGQTLAASSPPFVGNGVFKSTDAAATWSACNTASLGNLNVLSLGMNASASTLYAGTEAGVLVSDNDCASWTALNTGMP